ncbi:MAG TPA: DUF4148 domain-containing protein [Paraburkholderia sp.]|jgi:hypothetical protein
MNHSLKLRPMLAVSVFASVLVSALAGCAAGGGTQQDSRTHLSPTQCQDLTALRNKEPLTRERNLSQLAALEAAGYNPNWGFDPYYPADLQAAQKKVDQWYATDCQQVQQPQQPN